MRESSQNKIVISENDQLRSDFVCSLVQTTQQLSSSISKTIRPIPKIIVQFWDAPDKLPFDVQECIETWSYLDALGYERMMFNEHTARRFITETFTPQHVVAFDRCYHPAMKSDYFRLCFILSCGGCYIDVDDAYNGSSIEPLFKDGRLKLQPLCYDVETATMIQPDIFMNPINYSSSWIFYFNNNPLVASPGDPIIKYALKRATQILIKSDQNDLPKIQSTTGPGNLTASLVANMANRDLKRQEDNFFILSNWEAHAQTIWSLSYRQDSRNWRLSNKKQFIYEEESIDKYVNK